MKYIYINDIVFHWISKYTHPSSVWLYINSYWNVDIHHMSKVPSYSQTINLTGDTNCLLETSYHSINQSCVYCSGWYLSTMFSSLEWLGRWTQQWAVEGAFEVPRPAFETGLPLRKQFTHRWYLPCCQCTETCSNKIISICQCQVKVKWRIVSAQKRLAVVFNVWYRSAGANLFWPVGHGRMVRTMGTTVGGERCAFEIMRRTFWNWAHGTIRSYLEFTLPSVPWEMFSCLLHTKWYPPCLPELYLYKLLPREFCQFLYHNRLKHCLRLCILRKHMRTIKVNVSTVNSNSM